MADREHQGHDEATAISKLVRTLNMANDSGRRSWASSSRMTGRIPSLTVWSKASCSLRTRAGIDAGGREAAGDGKFLAQVTLGEAGHLDVADLEARLR